MAIAVKVILGKYIIFLYKKNEYQCGSSDRFVERGIQTFEKSNYNYNMNFYCIQQMANLQYSVPYGKLMWF